VLCVEVWRVLRLNGSLWSACLSQYQAILRDDEIRELRGAAYLYSLWGAIFAVPVQVLTVDAVYYGAYGRALLKWWEAAHLTFFEYLPNLALGTARSIAKYARVTRNAAVSCGRRAGDFVRVVILAVECSLSLVFFLPLAAYDVLEFLLQGEIGIAVTLLALNVANLYFEWTRYGVPGTVIAVTIALMTHIWRGCSGRTELGEMTPAAIVVKGLREVRARTVEREQVDAADLDRLREEGPQDGEDFVENDQESSVPVADTVAGGRSPTAITAELRAMEERSRSLRLELAQHPDVRRGRQTDGRGECPVTRLTGCVPGGRVLDSLSSVRPRRG
jgi:hypothetical protein